MAVEHKPVAGNFKVFNKHNYFQQKRNVIIFYPNRKLIWSMPNIVFYIEIDYLSIDESKLLNSNEDNAEIQGRCSHGNKCIL
jgi:hypothetical protein